MELKLVPEEGSNHLLQWAVGLLAGGITTFLFGIFLFFRGLSSIAEYPPDWLTSFPSEIVLEILLFQVLSIATMIGGGIFLLTCVIVFYLSRKHKK